MSKALVIGGTSGVGLALADELLQRGYDFVYIAGTDMPDPACALKTDRETFLEKTQFIPVNLVNDDYTFLDEAGDIDTLIITAGFGRVAPFEALLEHEIINQVKVNELAAIRAIHHYYGRLRGHEDFYCCIMGSIAGHVASPLFSVYGATKAALAMFIQNINAELSAAGGKNRILDISPGSLKGTGFSGGKNDLRLLGGLPGEIIDRMIRRETLYIPDYETTYRGVIERYRENPADFALDSYRYKIENNRLQPKPQGKVGYLSGTFDLFHIGHLNLLKRAKQYCDYLIVGVHNSGTWKGKETYIPYEERLEIIKNIKYVDLAVMAYTEDSAAWDALGFDRLFVGSDYKGTERFSRYEAYFKDKGVEIIYFPYTKGTSSTKLRDAISDKLKK